MTISSLAISLMICTSLIIFSRIFNIYDLPNERKLHKNPTSKLGGIGIVVSYFICSHIYSDINNELLASSLILIALILADDALDLNRYFRLLVQLIATLPIISSLDLSADKSIIAIFSIILICGFINLFNFFDGLNLILSSQFLLIITYYIGIQEIIRLDNFSDDMLIVQGSSLGFMMVNYFGLIFMGDIGSCFMGVFISMLFLSSIVSIDYYKWNILIAPLLPIMIDTILTILIRFKNGEKFFSTPHKQHGYQLLKLLGLTDIYVSIVYAIKFVLTTLPIYYFYNLKLNLISSILGIMIIISIDTLFLFYIRTKAFDKKLI